MSREQIEQVAAALRLFHHYGEPIELRRKMPDWTNAAGKKHKGAVECAWFPDAQSAAREAVMLDQSGKYVALWHGVNPRNVPASRCDQKWGGAGGKAEDIAVRRFLFLDFDRSKDNDRFATEEELFACRAVRTAVVAFLSEQGWGYPLLILSANGCHAFYALNGLSNTEDDEKRVVRLYASLSEVFATDAVKIDLSVKDIARVAAIPWTHSRKFNGEPRCVVLETEAWPG